MKNKVNRHGKIILILAMSAIVFSLIYISAVGLFTVYAVINKVPFLDIEKLPRHSSTYILLIISFVIGIVLSVVFRNYILVPLHHAYIALGKVADGNFGVSVNEKGIRAVRKVAKSVNTMAKELDNIETMRNDFINNFSHEFKTPIISISGFARMLKDSDLTQQEKEEYLDIIISESERLSQLSTNVLNLTKLNNQSIVTDRIDFNVTEQMRRTIILLEQKWENKNITVNFEADDYFIYANEELLSQLWINLLDNAIKFSPVGSEVSVNIIKDRNKLIFTVADSGKGMSEEEAAHAFDRFFQGDISHKSNGYGIGLAISKRICDLHEGSIRIKETGKTGTVLEIIFPTKSE